ncbi:tetratricopeptide repeat protein [Ktedonobacteria bacterium brp13]|nr:tetratricopeptide repeat protein [Ktedonobacteria bacterium brp13]
MSIARDMKKITCPALPATVLSRQALIVRFREAIVGPTEGLPHYKLVLVHAPAGYGKTTGLVDFARSSQIEFCWYFMDSTDVDKNAFLRTLIASIRFRFPQFGQELDALLDAAIAVETERLTTFQYEAIIDALISAIETDITERFVIALCNYQEINTCQAVNELMNRLLRKLPEHCVLLVESRATPDIEFAHLIANREMIGIGRTMLQFTASEIMDLSLMQGEVQLNEVEAEQLTASFEGWIMGILLGSRLGGVPFVPQWNHYVHASDKSQQVQLERHLLFSYMVNEVFERNPDVYAFLKEASILHEMVPDVCDTLLDIRNAQEHLNYLEQNGLFVTRIGEGQQTMYICHPVLRELLCQDLHQQSPERFVKLHQRAAELMRANNDYKKAVHHALEASADDIAARLIIDSEEQMLSQGHAETLVHWIDRLPAITTACHPRLLLIRANIYLIIGDHTGALALLDAASEAIVNRPTMVDAEDNVLLQIERTILVSKALFQRGDYRQVIELCEHIQQHLPADEVKLGADVHRLLGVCANVLGDFTRGIVQLQKALQLWGRHTVNRQTAEVQALLASAYSLLGNFALAEHHIARAITCWNQLHDEWGKINDTLRLGLIKQRQGAFLDAEAAFNQGLALARGPIHFQRAEAYALVDLGELYQEQALYERSLPMIEDGLALARRVKDRYLVNFALCILAMTYVYMGDAATALLLLSEVDIQKSQGEMLGYEQAARELVYGTILLHQRHYEDACSHLRKVEVSLQKMGIKREYIQVLLRIASCLLAQGETQECMRRLEEITDILTTQSDYEYFILIELRRQHRLLQTVMTHPELARLRAQLHLETEQESLPPAIIVKPEKASKPKSTVTVKDQPKVEILLNDQPKIAICALGEPSVIIEARPITRWRMARSMELFFLLLDNGRPMRKEQIISALWSELDDQINQTFHSTVYYLRKALEGHCIASQGSTYTLDLASYFGENITYDVTTFLNYQSQAKEAMSQEDDNATKEILLTMVDLYKGDYAQSFYNDWCTFRRDELRNAYLDVRRELAHIAWNQEQYDECTTHWQYALAVDDCLEEAHHGLMRCYIREGKRGLALRQYQRCRDTLQRELTAQPGRAVQSLYQRIMSQS